MTIDHPANAAQTRSLLHASPVRLAQTIRIEERHDASFLAVFEATAVLEQRQTPFQEAVVIETATHGRVLFLDGLLMLTEHTHHIYHEVMAHIPLSCVEDPKRVLIVGGGDGGTATEVCKWPGVEEVIVAELDVEVVEISRRWFPTLTAGLDDPRVRLEIGDGAAFVARHDRAFDVIIIDSTDICGPEPLGADEIASPLATRAFHETLAQALRPDGVGIQIVGNPYFYRKTMPGAVRTIRQPWTQFTFASMPAPFYITGPWVAGVFSMANPLTPRALPIPGAALNYMTEELARATLVVPANLKRMLDQT